MKFGIGIPNCREGVDYPAGFTTPGGIVKLCQSAEKLGFDSVWADDHLTPKLALLKRDPQPPSYFESFVTLSHVAAATKTIRLGIAVLVIVLREPVLVAKQVATLDVFSNGRVMLGVGIGTREEFQAVVPRAGKSHRGMMMDEQLQILNLLFTQKEASFTGKYYEFKDVALFPKPVQKPLPIYVTGNSPEAVPRMARWGQGCFMPPNEKEFQHRYEALCRNMDQIGRNVSEMDVAVSTTASIGRTHQEAVERLRRSRVSGRFKDKSIEEIMAENVVGSTAEVLEKIKRLEKAGLRHATFQRFAASSVDEVIEQMHLVAEEVMPAFK